MSEHRGEHRGVRRVHISEAAELLGISKDAVRMRIRRGTLRSEKENDRVYVWVNVDQESDQNTVRHEPQVETSELVEELRDRVRSLERMLEAEREARTEEQRRHDTLMARLMDRIPELEPAETPAERPEATPAEPQTPQESHEEPGRVDAPPTTSRPGDGDSGPLWHSDEAPEDAPRRPWWRRWFGG